MKWKELKEAHSNRLSEMAKMSPHALLGIPANAAPDQIKTAYLELVKTYHPDKSDPFMARHNEEVIKLVNAAYEKLKGNAR
jgi:curved DNA-binding protein CbpA